MKVEIKLPEEKQPFFIERRRITSARIVRSGFQDYGVIFTGIGKSNELDEEPPPDLKPSESDFDISLLPGAIIGWRSATDQEDHKFFEILGGYFYHQGGSKNGQTTKAFGIVKENAFEISEGGTTTVNDHWKLAEPSSRGLDEKDGNGGGWTFIVGWKDGGEFPHSSTQLKICADCPEIQSVVAAFGDCELDANTNTLKRKVTLKASVSGAEPKSWTWHFGDGQSKSGNGKPPESIEYLYAKKPASAPKLTLVGSHAVCQETNKEVDFSGFKECGSCPKIDSFVAEFGDCVQDQQNNKLRRKVTFKTSVSGGEPTKWSYDFGDGESESGTGLLPATIEHLYDSAPKSAPKLTLEAASPCQTVSKEADFSGFKECGSCPTIDSFVAEYGDCVYDQKRNKLSKKVTFKTSVSGGEPTKWTCDFGDGESESGTGMPPATAEHLYDKAPASAPKLTIEAASPCQTVSKEADFSGFEACPPCPEVKSVAVQANTEPETLVADFKVVTETGTANSYEWDWGDGSPKEKTTTPTATHKYRRLEKGDMDYTAKVTLMGPQECRAQGQTDVNVPKMPVKPEPEPEPEPPKVGPCLWMQLLVAFLLAMTGGILIVCIALASFYPAEDNTNEIIAVAIFAILSIASIIFWFSLVRQGKCARPGHCAWKAIAWVVLLAAALVALYIAGCCPAAWWVLILILLIVAAILLYLWLKQCSPATKTMLLHFAAALIAAIIVCIFFARHLLEACANGSM